MKLGYRECATSGLEELMIAEGGVICDRNKLYITEKCSPFTNGRTFP